MHIEHTDLAMEAKSIWENSASETTSLKGVKAAEEKRVDFTVTTVEVLDDEGAAALKKPIGTYITVDIAPYLGRRSASFERICNVISEILRNMINIDKNAGVLIAGLGNRAITPDCIGPETADMILATRHLKKASPEEFAFFRPVSVISPGTVGTTGIDSGDMIRSAASSSEPAAVIAVDALFSADPSRLCSTVQITDTGIIPGSGVGNAGSEVSRKTMGVPVVAVGVPTVTSVFSAARAMFGQDEQCVDSDSRDTVVTPRDIDRKTHEAAKVVAYAINMALHRGLTVGDIDMLL